MHLVKNLLALTLDLHTNVATKCCEFRADIVERLRSPLHIGYHHHVEIVLDNRLGYVKDVHPIVGKISARLGENANRVLADNRYYNLVHFSLPLNRDGREACHAPGIHRTCARGGAIP